MGVLFESILLFSLAVLIILMGLLVYYFKKRIVEVEQQNAKCLEIVQDVYMQHMKLRNEIIQNALDQPAQQFYRHQQQQQHQQDQEEPEEEKDNRIRVELSEEEDDDDDDYEDDDEMSQDNDDDDVDNEDQEEEAVKIVSVDLKIPENYEINEIDEDLEEEPEEEPELKSLEPSEPIIINKVGPAEISKEDFKKLTPSALKALLIGKGMPADQVNKMKKADLIKNLM